MTEAAKLRETIEKLHANVDRWCLPLSLARQTDLTASCLLMLEALEKITTLSGTLPQLHAERTISKVCGRFAEGR